MLTYHYVEVYQHDLFMLMFISVKNRLNNLYLEKYSILQKRDISTMWKNIFDHFFFNLKLLKVIKQKCNLQLPQTYAQISKKKN